MEPVGESCLLVDDEDDPVFRKNEEVAHRIRAVDGWSNPVGIINNSVDGLDGCSSIFLSKNRYLSILPITNSFLS